MGVCFFFFFVVFFFFQAFCFIPTRVCVCVLYIPDDLMTPDSLTCATVICASYIFYLCQVFLRQKKSNVL